MRAGKVLRHFPGSTRHNIRSVWRTHIMAVTYPTIPGVRFKDIEGFPGYCIGDDGSVWSRWKPHGGTYPAPVHEWRRLATAFVYGYIIVTLRQPDRNLPRRITRYVHRLLLTAFVGPCPEGMECRHLDGCRTNNQLSNLVWGTRAENISDRIAHGSCRGERNGRAKLTEDQVREARKMREEGANFRAIGRKLGINRVTVKAIIMRKTWRHISTDVAKLTAT